jgi:hypothetical protein
MVQPAVVVDILTHVSSLALLQAFSRGAVMLINPSQEIIAISFVASTQYRTANWHQHHSGTFKRRVHDDPPRVHYQNTRCDGRAPRNEVLKKE